MVNQPMKRLFAITLQSEPNLPNSMYDNFGRRRRGPMMVNPDRHLYYEPGLTRDGIEPTLSAGERLIRGILLVGFVTVLAIEAWLLWQVWQLWA